MRAKPETLAKKAYWVLVNRGRHISVLFSITRYSYHGFVCVMDLSMAHCGCYRIRRVSLSQSGVEGFVGKCSNHLDCLDSVECGFLDSSSWRLSRVVGDLLGRCWGFLVSTILPEA